MSRTDIRLRNHASREAAIRELMKHKFFPLSRRDGILVHSDGKQSYAVARDFTHGVFHLVSPPPEQTRLDLDTATRSH